MNYKRILLSLVSLLTVLAFALPATLHAWGSVKMYTDESYSKKISRKKLDCKIHANKKNSLTLGFKLGGAFIAKVGPEVTFAKTTQIRWNGLSQEIIRRYEELCDQHNRGHLTVAEFDRRHAKLDEYFEKAKGLKQEIQDNVFSRADKAFDDLDREAAKHSGEGSFSQEMQEQIKTYEGRVESLAGDVEKTFGVKKMDGAEDVQEGSETVAPEEKSAPEESN